MKPVHPFRVLRQQREPVAEIVLTRTDAVTPITIDAAHLVAQYETKSGDILLILDEDCPYEEQLHLVLVRGADAVVDHLVIGTPYAGGVFRELSAEGEVLRFCFHGDTVLRVQARPDPSRMPARLPHGARRKCGWFASHHLDLAAEAAICSKIA